MTRTEPRSSTAPLGLDTLTGARVMAVIYLVCWGTLATVASVVPDAKGADFLEIEAVCGLGVALGIVIWRLPWDRWPRAVSIVLAVAATGLIAGFEAVSSADGYRYGIFYVVVFAWVGLMHPQGTSLLLAPVLASAYLAPLLAAGRGWDAATASVLHIVIACTATGEVVAWVSAHLRRTHEELAHAQQELARSERLAAMGEMASIVGHEVRNPLAAATNAHYLLRQSIRDPDACLRHLTLAETQVARAATIADELMDYMRDWTLVPSLLDLRELIEDVLASTPPPDNIAVVVTELPRHISGDPGSLVQMLSNLVVNAYQAMPDGGQLRISGCSDGPMTELHFVDSGEGFDQAALVRALDPFFTTKTTGTGLGLAIVQRLAHRHGGTVILENSAAGGAHVTLRLGVPRSP